MAAESACEAFQEGVFPMAGEHSAGIVPVGRTAEGRGRVIVWSYG